MPSTEVPSDNLTSEEAGGGFGIAIVVIVVIMIFAVVGRRK